MKTLNSTCWNAGIDRCDALEGIKRCPETCSFYTTYQDSMASLLSANRLLSSLPQEQQERIADKYYSGNRPWFPKAGRDDD